MAGVTVESEMRSSQIVRPATTTAVAEDSQSYALVWPPRLARQPFLQSLIGYRPSTIPLPGRLPSMLVGEAGRRLDAIPALAKWAGIPALTVEDGFIRSVSPLARAALSLLVDDVASGGKNERHAQLIFALQTATASMSPIAMDAMKLVREHRISRYNDISEQTPSTFSVTGRRPQRVVVVDQTVDDPSLPGGRENANLFQGMLRAAREEHPAADLWILVHPETLAGRKRGVLAGAALPRGARLLTEVVNPFVLLDCVDQVYTVNAPLGFEALLSARPVSVFGQPFYAGWGQTDDRMLCQRRARTLTVEQIFAAAYVDYPRYLDPTTGERGDILDVIEFILHQRRVRKTYADLGAIEACGFSRWKRPYVKPFLHAGGSEIRWRSHSGSRVSGTVARWGAGAADGTPQELRVEDGFIRSIGLGSDFSPPWSLVLDRIGVYFDPRRGSQLEQLLNEYPFDEALRRRAASLRLRLIETGVTKYNVQRRHGAIQEPPRARKVVLVTGQVEDDASIVLGATDVKTSTQLLKLVREQNPGAHLIYKPHPDVLARNRRGLVDAGLLCDEVDIRSDVLGLIERADEVHTITSLSGFEALLRGKHVVTYGRPFYAGWGLTLDHEPQLRRKRRASLDELVAAALILYPLYWDWDLEGFTSCEAVVERFAARLSNQKFHRQDDWQRPLLKAGRWFTNVVLRRGL